MLLFFAATEAKQHREAALKAGVKNSLQSFYSLGCGKQIPNNKEFENYLLDSGGFSARKHGFDIDVKDYVRYLNNYNVKVAFNLDVRDNEKSLRNQKYLEENTKAYIIPVFHPTEWMDKKWDRLIDYYTEHYPYIACGGIAGREGKQRENTPRLFNYVFSRTKDKTRVHGLGVTNRIYLQNYPFYTVDSTSWMSAALFANSNVHGNEYMKANAKSRHFSLNTMEEIPYWFNLEKEITNLWEKRGIKWGEFNYDTFMKERKKNIPSFKEWKEKNG